MEIPGLNSLLEEFNSVETQVLGLSIDSKFCHKGWAEGFGGIKFPLLADFHPKGEVAKAYGLWLDEAGISDRATVLIDKDGKVLWSESVTPAGERQPLELLNKVKELT
jgi:alkyl hydroperoxide reductase subunit AhpC